MASCRYDKLNKGQVSAEDFRTMWKEAKNALRSQIEAEMKAAATATADTSATGGGTTKPEVTAAPSTPSPTADEVKSTDAKTPTVAVTDEKENKMPTTSETIEPFQLGQIFAHFDENKDGVLDKKEFESLINHAPALLKSPKQTNEVSTSISKPGGSGPIFPTEMVSGRLLTHYDETAGVPLPKNAVEGHKAMGNMVVPLFEAYKSRYEKLRYALTSKLLPKRESLLQMRRQICIASEELHVAKQAIQKETLKDVEGILERLQQAESLRQSKIRHQLVRLDEELSVIERVIGRVEQANESTTQPSTTGVVLTSAVPGVAPLETMRPHRAQEMVELVQQFGDLHSTIEKLVHKHIPVDADIPTDDFPKEVAERLEVMSQCDKYLHAMNVKDQLLWNAIQDKKKIEESAEAERKHSHEMAYEVTEWADLSQNLTSQLNQSKEEIKLLNMKNAQLIEIMRKHNIYPHM